MPNGYINKGTLLSVPTMESRFGRDAAVATCNEEGGDLGYFFLVLAVVIRILKDISVWMVNVEQFL